MENKAVAAPISFLFNSVFSKCSNNSISARTGIHLTFLAVEAGPEPIPAFSDRGENSIHIISHNSANEETSHVVLNLCKIRIPSSYVLRLARVNHQRCGNGPTCRATRV